MKMSKAEERRLVFQRRIEKERGSLGQPAQEAHFKVVANVQHVAYITAVKDGCRYNITDLRVAKSELLDWEDVKAIRRMVETGQCDEGNEAVYYSVYDERLSDDPRDVKFHQFRHRAVRLRVMGN